MTNALRQYRQTHRISLAALAKLARTTKSSLSRIETGKQTPSLALISRLIVATHGAISADDFLPDLNDGGA